MNYLLNVQARTCATGRGKACDLQVGDAEAPNSHNVSLFRLVELRNSGSIINLLSNQYYTFPPWPESYLPQALARSKDVSDVLFTCTFSMPGGLIQSMKNRSFILFILSQSFKPQGL